MNKIEVCEALELGREGIQALSVASCQCMTKTPEARYHDPSCRYRQLQDADWKLRTLKERIERADMDEFTTLEGDDLHEVKRLYLLIDWSEGEGG